MRNDQTPSTNLYVPALAGLYDGLSGLAYPFIRFVTGLWAMPHGAGKLFGWLCHINFAAENLGGKDL